TLRVRIGKRVVTRQDVGSPSDQPDEGDRRKAAVSDALKRAAVKLGIGRYLYRLPKQWHDWDPQKKQFVGKPTLAATALPPVVVTTTNDTTATNGTPSTNGTGTTFKARLDAFDARLVEAGLCKAGECYRHARPEDPRRVERPLRSRGLGAART